VWIVWALGITCRWKRHILIINNKNNNQATDVITFMRESENYVNGTTHCLLCVDDVVATLVT